MSSIPTKQIDGDVSVGRDVNIGGKTTIRGSAKVGHNLTVDGWLEAKNIKGPNKGLFKTAAQLREAYPNPHKGWWALVTIEGSVASDHLGQLYVVDGGTWVAQVDSNGNPLLRGNPTVDSTKYFDAYIETLKPWLGGTLGSFDSSEAFNNYLDGLTYNSLKSGRYVAYLGGVPFFVTFTLLYAKEQISAVWVEGSLMVSDNAINSNTGKGVTIAYRYHKNGAWEAWRTIYDELNGAVASQGSRISTLEGKMPTVQTSANGTNKNFIYSTNDRESTYTVLSGKIWMYTHTDRNLFLRFKNWGAENDTNATNYNQVLLCHLVNKNQDGLMDKYVFARILNNNLAEGLSTTDKVIVNYTNFAESGNKQFELTKATTAKAGVMSVAQVNALNALTLFKNTKGQPDGLAPLDESGKVASEYLPEYVNDVVEFIGIVSGITPELASLDKSSTDVGCRVVYSKDNNVFMLKYAQKYYNNWVDGDLFGEPSANGRVPHKGKIYIDVIANKTYRWGGSTLKTIGCATAQDGVQGTSENYVYSSASDETRTILSSKMWTYTHSDGNLFLRFKHWGANNDTQLENYSQVMLTGHVSNSNWGLMNPYLYARLNNHTLTEGQSTLDAVEVNYTRFDDSGNKVLTLTKATTAKAGVMTAAQVTALNKAIEDIQTLNERIVALEKKVSALEAKLK